MANFVNLTARPLQLPNDVSNVSLRATSYMGVPSVIPKEYHEAFYTSHGPLKKGRQTANTAAHYATLVTHWFFNGLHFVKFNVAPHVQNSEAEVMAFFREIISSFQPRHEHKSAYLAYFLTQTCTSVDWEPA